MLADAPPAPVVAAPARATAIGVGEKEFKVALYRTRVRAGALRFNVRNLGEDDHDLVVRRAGRRIAGLSAIKPGATATLALTLGTPGRYQLVCTLADHEARGMRATLRVVRRRSGVGPRGLEAPAVAASPSMGVREETRSGRSGPDDASTPGTMNG
jgi:plastocyanin